MALLAAAGCRRGPTGPDASYQKASRLYQQLYASQLDDAYGDPKMDEVVALLKKVDPRSVDADAAQTMLNAIAHGREALAKQRAEREKMAAAAAAQNAGSPMINIDPEKILAAGAPDAGPAQDPYGPGAEVAAINSQSSGCLMDNEPFTEQGTGVAGVVYRVAPSDSCKERLPGFVGQAILVVNGKIYRRIADPTPPPPPPPPRAAAPPDAGAPAAAQAAAPPTAPPPSAPPAAPPDAGEEPQYQVVVPGAPQPGQPPQQAEQQGQ